MNMEIMDAKNIYYSTTDLGLGNKPNVTDVITESLDADCNSNHTIMATMATAADRLTASNFSNGSQDVDFVQDNSDYQWFLDYGYRESSLQRQSVLSSLCESYGPTLDGYGYYGVLSRTMDANLAEADIESFKTEDIHSLLTTYPEMGDDQNSQDLNGSGNIYSMSESALDKTDSFTSPHLSTKDEATSNSIDTMSLCKSELLFSPVKETAHAINYSVDSLDCDLLNEHDIMLTCQANLNNYTIAFEGSMTEDSQYTTAADQSNASKTTNSQSPRNWRLTQSSDKDLMRQLKRSMTRSDAGLTTWSKLKNRSTKHLRRQTSGNNNVPSRANRSRSLPNLHDINKRVGHIGRSHSSSESFNQNKSETDCIKVFDVHNDASASVYNASDFVSSSGDDSSSSHAVNFSLVKRFIKHKSLSADYREFNNSKYDYTSTQSHDSYQIRNQAYFDTDHTRSLSDYKSTVANNWLNNATNVDSLTKSSSAIVEEDETTDDTRSNVTYSIHDRCTGSVTSRTTFDSPLVTPLTTPLCTPKRRNLLRVTQSHRDTQVGCPFNLLTNQSIQTSLTGPIAQPPQPTQISTSFYDKLRQSNNRAPVYVLYPKYALPDLDFIRYDDNVILTPQTIQPTFVAPAQKPATKKLANVKDWESLAQLLPINYRKYYQSHDGERNDQKRRPYSYAGDYTACTPVTTASSTSSTATQPSSGYRGSSTLLLTDSVQSPAPTNNPLFVYKYNDSVTSVDENTVVDVDAHKRTVVKMRSNSLSDDLKSTPSKPPLPRVRKSKRFSMIEMGARKSSEQNVFFNLTNAPQLDTSLDFKDQADLIEFAEFLKRSSADRSSDSCRVDEFLALKMSRNFVRKDIFPTHARDTIKIDTLINKRIQRLLNEPINEESESLESSPKHVSPRHAHCQTSCSYAVTCHQMCLGNGPGCRQVASACHPCAIKCPGMCEMYAACNHQCANQSNCRYNQTNQRPACNCSNPTIHYSNSDSKINYVTYKPKFVNNKNLTRFDDEDYTDSLEPHVNLQAKRPDATFEPSESISSNYSDDIFNEEIVKSDKFKKLQRKWELMTNKDEPRTPVISKIPVSKIPRLVTPASPVRSKSAEFPVKRVSKIPMAKRQSMEVKMPVAIKPSINRTSRVDQPELEPAPRQIARPSSMPYRKVDGDSKMPRRAASSSVHRKGATIAKPPVKTATGTSRSVKTLKARRATEAGHLSYKKDERLIVVLDVDNKWLLCSLGAQKGLVPRTDVASI